MVSTEYRAYNWSLWLCPGPHSGVQGRASDNCPLKLKWTPYEGENLQHSPYFTNGSVTGKIC